MTDFKNSGVQQALLELHKALTGASGGDRAGVQAHPVQSLDAEQLARFLANLATGLYESVRALPVGDEFSVVVDSNGRCSELTIRTSDGAIADWVLARWAARLVKDHSFIDGSTAYQKYRTSGPGTKLTILPHDKYIRDGELLPAAPDMLDVSVWGSSSSSFSREEFSAAFSEIDSNIVYYNGGKWGEFWRNCYARLGAIPALVTIADNTIPASGSVAVTSSNMPLNSRMLAYTGTLGGIDGALAYSAGSYVFTRTAAGAPVAIEPDTPFLPTIGPKHRNGVLLLWAGKNDFRNASAAINNPRAFLDATWTVFEWAAPLVKRVLVLGPHQSRHTPSVCAERDRINMVNAELQATYGLHFFDVQAYMTSPDVWTDTGLAPKRADLAAQANGNLPGSLARGSLHFNKAMNSALAARVVERVRELGWY